uniref:DUF4283 domain-containing protein n=1 Tax=Arundo donax TaxID=35708 RepID=A0A0A8ZS86_ARUDO
MGRLQSVWIKIRGLPLHLVRWYVLAQVVSNMKKLKDIDLKASRNARFTYTRLLMSCICPQHLPKSVKVEVDNCIYEVLVEVELGGSGQK